MGGKKRDAVPKLLFCLFAVSLAGEWELAYCWCSQQVMHSAFLQDFNSQSETKIFEFCVFSPQLTWCGRLVHPAVTVQLAVAAVCRACRPQRHMKSPAASLHLPELQEEGSDTRDQSYICCTGASNRWVNWRRGRTSHLRTLTHTCMIWTLMSETTFCRSNEKKTWTGFRYFITAVWTNRPQQKMDRD